MKKILMSFYTLAAFLWSFFSTLFKKQVRIVSREKADYLFSC